MKKLLVIIIFIISSCTKTSDTTTYLVTAKYTGIDNKKYFSLSTLDLKILDRNFLTYETTDELYDKILVGRYIQLNENNEFIKEGKE